MPFKVGDWIEKKPFGAGQIIEDRSTYFSIRFVTGGEKNLAKDYVTTPSQPPHPGFEFPRAAARQKTSRSSASTGLGPAFSFDHLCERFIGLFPQNFDDPRFDDEERQYKETAAHRFQENLGRSQFDELLATGQHAEIAKRAKQLTSGKMNLIFPQELMSFNDALKTAECQLKFADSLFDVLYGSESEEIRFERYVDVLGTIGCLKWTTATYFQFIATSGDSMFMKPSVAKLFAPAVGVELNYSATPRWITYEKLNETSEIVRQRLLAMGWKPRHGMDIQSFMYRAWEQTK